MMTSDMRSKGSRRGELTRTDVLVRALREEDLSAAERIFRVAFGTVLGAPEPEAFWADRDYVRSRWRAPYTSAFGAEAGGELVGSAFAARWGSVGVFGPLTIRPDLWDQRIGSRLLEAAMEQFSDWGTRHVGLFTFAQSAKHVGLYQKFGFWPRFLTALMSAPVRQTGIQPSWSRFSSLPESEKTRSLDACRKLSDAIYEGLDLTGEIRAVHDQQLGDTVLLRDEAGLAGFAICHYGPTSEAGAGACYIKFGAVRPGPSAEQAFGSLLDACEGQAAAQSLPTLSAGVNMARHEAYRHMIARGFHAEVQGVTMHHPNEAAYSGPGIYVLDDWR
jgi:GNAT superfamily N-acetyltransferase